MKTITKLLLVGLTVLALTACGGSSSGDSTRDDAINKISNYAQNGGAAPTLQDYTDAGVTGISNVDEINAFILGLTAEQVDTTEEIQSIANQLGVTIEGNIPPIALATAAPSQTITEGETVTLYGHTSSSDPDGEIVGYAWMENGVVFSNTTPLSKSDFSVGEHLLTLVVTDNDGATSFDTILITVNAAATVPVTPPTCLEAAGYGTVTLSNGQVWLDRNLGASQVATSPTDTLAYGNLYQWGRGADGHESRSSSVIQGTHATALDPNSAYAWAGQFITEGQGGTNFDWTIGSLDPDGAIRSGYWSSPQSDTNPNQVCPCGFVVPSTVDFSNSTATDLHDILKLPYSGARQESGFINDSDPYGEYWTSDNSRGVLSINFTIADRDFLNGVARMKGLAVRCIDPSSRPIR